MMVESFTGNDGYNLLLGDHSIQEYQILKNFEWIACALHLYNLKFDSYNFVACHGYEGMGDDCLLGNIFDDCLLGNIFPSVF